MQMRFFDAINRYDYITRETWCGRFVDCQDDCYVSHALPGLDEPVTIFDFASRDWIEFKMPVLASDTVI
jgi:hypothetical protein